MDIFVTGGSGFVGTAVIRELIAAGHGVRGLARREPSAAALASLGAVPVPGALEDLPALRAAADGCDAVVHVAFDNSGLRAFVRGRRTERATLRAIGEVLAGSDRPVVAAGGFAPVSAAGTMITEADTARGTSSPISRHVERTVMDLAARGVNASVVRLAAVHGDGDRFTMPRLIAIARRTGRSAYVGDGANRVPAVHVDDAARLFRRAVERAIPGSRLHAVGEQGVRFRDVAEVIGRRLEIPVVGLSPVAAPRHFGMFAGFAGRDAPAASAMTQARYGWVPTGPGLIEDLDRAAYFEG